MSSLLRHIELLRWIERTFKGESHTFVRGAIVDELIKRYEDSNTKENMLPLLSACSQSVRLDDINKAITIIKGMLDVKTEVFERRELLCMLGYCQLRIGNYNEAVKHLNLCLELDSNFVRASDLRQLALNKIRSEGNGLTVADAAVYTGLLILGAMSASAFTMFLAEEWQKLIPEWMEAAKVGESLGKRFNREKSTGTFIIAGAVGAAVSTFTQTYVKGNK